MHNQQAGKSTWRRIKHDLERRILAHEFKLHDKFYSVNELARKYNVSHITSRRVISELSSEGFVESIPRKGSFVRSRLGNKDIYLLSELAENFKAGFNQLSSEIYRGMITECTQRNANLKLISSKYLKLWPKDKEMLLIQWHSPLKEDILNEIQGRKKCFFVNCHPPKPISGQVTVTGDITKGMEIAVEHCISRGHKRIALLTSSLKNEWMVPRFDGYYNGLRKDNISLDFSLIKEIDQENYVDVAEAVSELMNLPEPPSALLTSNSTKAMLVIEYCREQKIRIPEKLAVVGFDNFPESLISSPQLTVVDLQYNLIGSEAISMLLKMAEGENTEDVYIQPKLIIREST